MLNFINLQFITIPSSNLIYSVQFSSSIKFGFIEVLLLRYSTGMKHISLSFYNDSTSAIPITFLSFHIYPLNVLCHVYWMKQNIWVTWFLVRKSIKMINPHFDSLNHQLKLIVKQILPALNHLVFDVKDMHDQAILDRNKVITTKIQIIWKV